MRRLREMVGEKVVLPNIVCFHDIIQLVSAFGNRSAFFSTSCHPDDGNIAAKKHMLLFYSASEWPAARVSAFSSFFCGVSFSGGTQQWTVSRHAL